MEQVEKGKAEVQRTAEITEPVYGPWETSPALQSQKEMQMPTPLRHQIPVRKQARTNPKTLCRLQIVTPRKQHAIPHRRTHHFRVSILKTWDRIQICQSLICYVHLERGEDERTKGPKLDTVSKADGCNLDYNFGNIAGESHARSCQQLWKSKGCYEDSHDARRVKHTSDPHLFEPSMMAVSAS